MILRRPERRGGHGGDAAGHRLDDDLAEALARRREHEQVGGPEQLRQLGLVVPACEHDARDPEPLDRVGGVLALPLAGMAADEDQGGGLRHPRARVGERLEQQAQALDLGEAPDVEDHGAARDGVDRPLVVAHAPGARAGPPAPRRLDERAAPHRTAVDLEGPEHERIEPVRERHEAPDGQVEQSGGAIPAARGDDEPPRRRGPRAQARGPRRAMGPAPGVARDRLEHQQLGPVQVRDDRHARRDRGGRRVEGREVVQVQDVGLGRARTQQLARPGGHLVLVGGVVERGEDAVVRTRAVLEGGLERRGPFRPGEAGGVVALQRGREVDLAQVEPGVEPPRVAQAL